MLLSFLLFYFVLHCFTLIITLIYLTMYYSTTSDPSDGFSNHWSNAEEEKEEKVLTRKQLNRKRKSRLYWRFMVA